MSQMSKTLPLPLLRTRAFLSRVQHGAVTTETMVALLKTPLAVAVGTVVAVTEKRGRDAERWAFCYQGSRRTTFSRAGKTVLGFKRE